MTYLLFFVLYFNNNIMADHSDDEDAYLYGSDDEAGVKSVGKNESNTKSVSLPNARSEKEVEEVEEEDDDDLSLIHI